MALVFEPGASEGAYPERAGACRAQWRLFHAQLFAAAPQQQPAGGGFSVEWIVADMALRQLDACLECSQSHLIGEPSWSKRLLAGGRPFVAPTYTNDQQFA